MAGRQDEEAAGAPGTWGPSAAVMVKKAWEGVAGNPRRTVHAFKVGLALAITSTTVLQNRLYRMLGDNAIWSVMSVVVVFELTAGATIYKGSNRALGTLLAGTLALVVECLADFAGPVGEPFVVGISVFLVGAAATYTRFCEPFKRNYDYGVMIFLLTFSLIIISSYRVASYSALAVSRFLNIILGGVICLVTNMLIKPIWASEDLHNMIRTNFENLAKAIEDFTKAYIKEGIQQHDSGENDPIYDSYNAVLSSKSNEESLANYAIWEPRWKGVRGVWSQYVKVGGMLRYSTYTVASLHGCLISNTQAPYALRKPFSTVCKRVAMEAVSLLRRMGEAIEKRERSGTKEELMAALVMETEKLKQVVSSYGEVPLMQGKLGLVLCSRPQTPVREEEQKQKEKRQAGEEEDGMQGSAAAVSVCLDRTEPIHEVLAIAAVVYFLIELIPRLADLVDSVQTLEKLAGFRASQKLKGTEPPPAPLVHSRPRFDSVTIQTTD